MTNASACWYLHPTLLALGYGLFAMAFLGVAESRFLIVNPLTIACYVGAMLFGAPLNIFTIIAWLVYWKTGNEHAVVAGFLNLAVSLAWLFSVFGLGWFLTV